MTTDQGVHAATRALRALLRHADAADVAVQSATLHAGALTVLVESYWDFDRLHERLGAARRYFRSTEAFWMNQEPVRVCSSYRHTSGASVTIQGPLPPSASVPGGRRSEVRRAQAPRPAPVRELTPAHPGELTRETGRSRA